MRILLKMMPGGTCLGLLLLYVQQSISEVCVCRFSSDNIPKTMALLNDLKAIAKRHNATPGQVCLAWLLAQGEDIIPIPGTQTIKVRHDFLLFSRVDILRQYLEENAAAVNIKLTPEEVNAVRKAAIASGALDVPRYPEAQLEMTAVESPLPKST